VLFSKETYDANLSFIHENRHVIDQIKSMDIMQLEKKYKFERSREGNIILSYKKDKETVRYLHSTYSPIKEAKRFVDGNSERINKMFNHSTAFDKKKIEVMIYGLACCYHIREIINQYPDVIVNVVDFNPELFHYSLGFLDLKDLITNPNVRLIVTKDKHKILNELENNTSHSPFILYKPCVQLIPNDLLEVKEFLLDLDLQRQTADMNKNLLEHNFVSNTQIDYKDCSPFIQLMKDTPMILVSAGPSLMKNINLLKQASEFALIGVVGTAVKPLLSQGIQPDFIMLTDPTNNIVNQLDGNFEFPLFYLSTVYSEVVKLYKGPKFIVFQEGYGKAEIVANELRVKRIKTGGSVATTLLDFMVQIGANPICFVGQDLSYSNGQSHAKGTHLYRNIKEDLTLHYVENYYQNQKIPTSGNLKSYLRWFNRYIEDNPDIDFYNATEGGAYIDGATHISLSEFIDIIKSKTIESQRGLFYDTIKQHSKQ
jgi:hypothetical protein